MKIGNRIYLDHQATTPVDAKVLTAMAPFWGESFGNPHSAEHSFGWKAAKAVDDAASRLARLIGADTDEIIFTSGATEANNLALLGLGRRSMGGKRRRILVSAVEHKCVLAVGKILQDQLGYKVETVPVDAVGLVNLPVFQELLADDVLAVSIMAVNNEIGTMQEIEKISEIIKKSGAIFHCDAAQAPCAIDIGQFSQFVDLISLSGHKMYGPQGIGGLFIRRGLQHCIEPLIYGGGQQRELRSGTIPVALCVGMGAAATLLSGDDAELERKLLRNRRDMFLNKVMSLKWPTTLNGPENERRHPGNANIRFDGFEAQDIINTLQPSLAVATGAACTSGIPHPSHVLRAIGLSSEEAESSIRFSIGRSTSEADLEEAVAILDKCLSRLADKNLFRESKKN